MKEATEENRDSRDYSFVPLFFPQNKLMTVRLVPLGISVGRVVDAISSRKETTIGHRRRNNCSSLVPQKQCTPLAFIISIPPSLGGATISFLCPSGIVPLVLRERRPVHLTKYRSILMDTPVARRAGQPPARHIDDTSRRFKGY